jgi:hypothetical protein
MGDKARHARARVGMKHRVPAASRYLRSALGRTRDAQRSSARAVASQQRAATPVTGAAGTPHERREWLGRAWPVHLA